MIVAELVLAFVKELLLSAICCNFARVSHLSVRLLSDIYQKRHMEFHCQMESSDAPDPVTIFLASAPSRYRDMTLVYDTNTRTQ